MILVIRANKFKTYMERLHARKPHSKPCFNKIEIEFRVGTPT